MFKYEHLKIFTSIFFIQNLILIKIYLLLSYKSFPIKISNNFLLGFFISIINFFSSIFIWVIKFYFIIPYNLYYLNTYINILIIGFIAQILAIILYKVHIKYFFIFKNFFLLRIPNIIIIFIPLFNCNFYKEFIYYLIYNFISSILFFSIIIIIFFFYKKIQSLKKIPKYFKGNSIVFISIGLIYIIFLD